MIYTKKLLALLLSVLMLASFVGCDSSLAEDIKKKVGICEAEVGTGKTLAFLVAALAIKIAKRGEKNVGVNPITILLRH